MLVEAMARLTRILYLAFACSFALSVLSLCFHDLYMGYVYDRYRRTDLVVHDLWQILDIFKNPGWFYKCYLNQSVLREFCNLLLLAGGVIVFAKKWKKILAKASDSVTITFFRDIRQTFPSYKYVVILSLAPVVCLLLWGTYDCLKTAWHFGLRDIAYVVDGLGAYETGEQIFSLTSHGDGSTLASTSGSTGHDSDRDEIDKNRLNDMVRRTYGATSLEMARRQAILANHLQSNFEDYDAAAKARKDAIGTYTLLGCKYERATNLAFLAYIQTEQHNFGAARESVSKAYEVTQDESISSRDRADIVFDLEPALTILGEEERSNQLTQQIRNNSSNGHHGPVVKRFDGFVDYFLCAIFLLLIAAGFAIMKVKKEVMNRLALRWSVEFNSANSDEERVWWLNKMINLELYRRRIEVAHTFSDDLLLIVSRADFNCHKR